MRCFSFWGFPPEKLPIYFSGAFSYAGSAYIYIYIYIQIDRQISHLESINISIVQLDMHTHSLGVCLGKQTVEQSRVYNEPRNVHIQDMLGSLGFLRPETGSRVYLYRVSYIECILCLLYRTLLYLSMEHGCTPGLRRCRDINVIDVLSSDRGLSISSCSILYMPTVVRHSLSYGMHRLHTYRLYPIAERRQMDVRTDRCRDRGCIEIQSVVYTAPTLHRYLHALGKRRYLGPVYIYVYHARHTGVGYRYIYSIGAGDGCPSRGDISDIDVLSGAVCTHGVPRVCAVHMQEQSVY